MRRLFLILLLAAGMSTAAIAEESATRSISVSGEGKATAPPDMATINTGVVTQAEKAADALEANNQAMERIMAVLKEFRIAAKDIQTSSFDVRPEYRRSRGPQGPQEPQIVGYRVTNQVSVKVRNLPQLGQVLDALINAGSNQVSGVSFGIDDPTGVMNQARNRAVADARSRAALYAQAAGVGVGKVLTISEQVMQVPRPPMMGRAMMAAEAGSVPIATGEQEIRATVHMVFALEDLE